MQKSLQLSLLSISIIGSLVLCQCRSKKHVGQIEKLANIKSKITEIIGQTPNLPYSAEGIIEIRVPEKPDNNRINIFSIKKYLPLETTKDFIIGEISRLKIVNSKIYILDLKTNSVIIFSDNGKFLKRIHDVGPGPNEYIDLSAMQVSKENNFIALYDPQRKKFIYYDLEGNFLSVKQGSIWVRDFAMFETGEFCYYLEKQYGNVSDVLVTDKNLIPRKKGIAGIPPNQSLNYHGGRGSFEDYQDKKLLMSSFRDTVYELTPSSIRAKYALKYTGHPLPQNYADGGINVFLKKAAAEPFNFSLGDILENEDFVIFMISMGGNSDWRDLIYSKKSGATHWGTIQDKKTTLQFGSPVINNTDSSLIIELFPEAALILYKEYQDKKITLPKELIDVCKNLKKYDNPILCFLEYKPF